MNFKAFLEHNPLKIQNYFSQNTVGKHNDAAAAAFLPSTYTGSEDLGTMGYGLPSTDLKIPTTTRDSIILQVLNAPATKNHKRTNDKSQKDVIKVIMKDGTTIHLSLDQYKRIVSKRSLEPGDKISVTFMRLPSDTGLSLSKIIRIE